MNMKKTLAGLMAGIVAISAMATVAVSAKAQKAEEVTWSTKAKEVKNAETMVYVTIPATEWQKNATIQLLDAAAGAPRYEIKEITKITLRQTGNTSVIDEDVNVYYNLHEDDNAIPVDTLKILTDAPDAAADIELAIKVEETTGADVKKNSIKTVSAGFATANGDAVLSTTNVKKDADETKKGALLNKAGLQGITIDGDIAWVRDLDVTITDHMNTARNLEVASEIADVLKDAKGATIAFNFAKEDIDDSVADKEFSQWVDRYDWQSDSMKSAISFRVNNSTVLSVDMMEFDKTNFSAVYSWDEVIAKFQVGSVTGLVNTMGLKIDNSKLPDKKDKDEVIDLRLESITVKIPEMADTKDDSMVEDFAAGESATVVEDTLPATTDAPAATDATTAATEGAANPETGNSAIALLAIPAALAAAAIVAKKRG